MENQTLSLFGRDLFQGSMSRTVTAELYISHELAHQWFGDSVTPAEWQDIWLNEGFATYASWLWSEHDRGEDGMAIWVDRALRVVAREDDVPPGDPGIDELFGTSVYQRGALTLHALRLAVGDDLFFEIVREWVFRYEHGNATTEDFISLALEKAGHLPGVDLAALLDAWLFDEDLPELPEQRSNT
jgi:aminopeptidase N